MNNNFKKIHNKISNKSKIIITKFKIILKNFNNLKKQISCKCKLKKSKKEIVKKKLNK